MSCRSRNSRQEQGHSTRLDGSSECLPTSGCRSRSVLDALLVRAPSANSEASDPSPAKAAHLRMEERGIAIRAECGRPAELERVVHAETRRSWCARSGRGCGSFSVILHALDAKERVVRRRSCGRQRGPFLPARLANAVCSRRSPKTMTARPGYPALAQAVGAAEPDLAEIGSPSVARDRALRAGKPGSIVSSCSSTRSVLQRLSSE